MPGPMINPQDRQPPPEKLPEVNFPDGRLPEGITQFGLMALTAARHGGRATGARPPRARWLADAELLRGELCSLYSVRNLLECDVTCIVRRTVVGFLVDAER